MADENPHPNLKPEKIKPMFRWSPVALAVLLLTAIGNMIAAWTLYSIHLVHLIYPILSTLILFLGSIGISIICFCFRRSSVFESWVAKIERISQPLSRMRTEDLWRATDDFCDRNVIGRGRFGRVYRGFLPNGRIVTIKCFQLEEGQFSAKHFLSELKTLGRLRHRNLVRILGYSFDGSDHEMALILDTQRELRWSTSERLGEDVSLPQWVKMESLCDPLKVMDDCLKSSSEFHNEIQRAVSIAMLCTNECAGLRADMKDVLKALKDITEEERLRRFNVPVYVLAQQGAPRLSSTVPTSSTSTSTTTSF